MFIIMISFSNPGSAPAAPLPSSPLNEKPTPYSETDTRWFAREGFVGVGEALKINFTSVEPNGQVEAGAS